MNLYPWILTVGALLVIAFTFFGVTMLGWCTGNNDIPSLPTTTGISFDDKLSFCRSLESHSITFQYKAEEAAEGTNQTECVICFSAFEDEESVRKLHSCKHIFHTSCIDQWLASHSGCPLCRTQIDKGGSPKGTLASEENDQMIRIILTS